ncbi:MAG: TAXI family TRAP transporter solute-binding subunit [Burkholderiaceae bacterium]
MNSLGHYLAMASITVAFATLPITSFGKAFSMEVASTGCTTAVGLPMVKYAKGAGVDIQIATGKTLTKSALLVGQGKLDFSAYVPLPYLLLKQGKAMYQKLGAEKGAKLAGNLRGIMGFECGQYTPIVWADSGITKWEQFKGKRIFTGPPSGAAAKNSEDFIKAMTGFEPNKDYEAIRLAWGGGQQAMRDGQLDVYMRPIQVPSALVEELIGIRPVRFLGITPEAEKSPTMQQYMKAVGRFPSAIKPQELYGPKVHSEPSIKLPGFALDMIAGVHVPEDVVYKVTKAYWEKLDEIHKSDPTLRGITRETAFLGLNVPLHDGALKYYKEAGFKIPDRLIIK